MDDAAFIAELDRALQSDTACLDASAPAARFEELGLLGVAVHLAKGRTISPTIHSVVEHLLAGSSLVEHLEDLCVEHCLGLVERVAEEVEEEGLVSSLEEACLRLAKDFARWGWDDDLAAHVPVFVEIILDTLDEANRPAVMFALAVLTAFATVHAVPSAEEKLAMIRGSQLHDPHANAAAVTAFALAVCGGRDYRLLAYLAARTNHAGVLAEFAALAPAPALGLLATELAIVNGTSEADVGGLG
jgi:hypothetical protein